MRTSGIVDNLETAAALLDAARSPDDVFAPTPSADARRIYRRLARLTHPDRYASDLDAIRARANTAFRRLEELWTTWTATRPESVISTRSRTYLLGDPLAHGDLTTLYSATASSNAPSATRPAGDDETPVVVKIPRDPANSDLLANEANALRRLAAGEKRFRPYVPVLVESFRHQSLGHQSPSGELRTLNVLEPLDGFVSLAEVAAAFPAGLDPRDVAWMWRRLLVALGFAHRCSTIHGAPLPEHVLIEPDLHGLVLVDWCYAAVGPNATIPALCPRYSSWYPPEVLDRARPTPATDLFIAAHLIESLIAPPIPPPLRGFLDWSLDPDPTRRPSDAWAALEDLDRLLGQLYGPRTFRPFSMPTNPPTTDNNRTDNKET